MIEKEIAPEILRLGRQIITFIGPEGSGKTTVAKRLAKEANKPYITTGDIIRNLAEFDEGPLGEECRQMFRDKRYLSGETLIKLLTFRFQQSDTRDGLVLDGGLRTLEETIAFKGMLVEANLDLRMNVIYLNVTPEVTFERLVSGPMARKRADDTEVGVACRLEKFNLNLVRRLEVISSQPGWGIYHLDGSLGPEEVYAQVCKVLTGLGE